MLGSLLNAYKADGVIEKHNKMSMLDLLSSHTNCFDRTCMPAHFTASAWLLDYTGNRCLLMHHAKLNRWVQLGGHCDGNSDLLAVAVREAQEESGIMAIEPVQTSIFDIDIHDIPAHHQEPSHQHFDVRFLLRAKDDVPFVRNEESLALAWFDSNKANLPSQEASILRMFDKWQAYLNR